MITRSRSSTGNIPVHRIDLDLPPHERYKALALQYKAQISTITPLFNELLADLGIPVNRHDNVNTTARWFLRRVHSAEETEELRGISEVTGVAMYLLVALNVVLDLLMGCTSSVVRSSEGICWHLRTLDWGMDALRRIVVQLDFVRSKSSGEEIIARSISYVGFVGVLTGVRTNLSMSLNFRAYHNATTKWAHFRFYLHHLAVLLGLRPSISSILRECLLSTVTPTLAQLKDSLSPRHTTACYLTFSSGERGLVLEKDFDTATSRMDIDGFVVATNHDVDHPASDQKPTPGATHASQSAKTEAMQDLVEDSKERSACVSSKWSEHLRSATRKNSSLGITKSQAVQWVSDWPTTNETTHYAVVMDPGAGRIAWAHVYHDPVHGPHAYN